MGNISAGPAPVWRSGSASTLRSRYLVIGYLPSEVSLAFEPMHELTLGSKRRATEARQCVIRLLRRRRIKPWREDEEVRASIPPHPFDQLPNLLFEIDASLDVFRKQRLCPPVVEEILGPVWAPFDAADNRGFFALHPAAKITALARQPATIEAGRRKDERRSSSIKNPR
jgi:hypothetical protein